jgi:hypothetical protein
MSLPQLLTSDEEADTLPGQTPFGQSRAGFHLRTGLTWAVLLTLLIGLFSRMGLDFGLIQQKLPFMLGLRLSPDGFIQGAALTLVITVIVAGYFDRRRAVIQQWNRLWLRDVLRLAVSRNAAVGPGIDNLSGVAAGRYCSGGIQLGYYCLVA